MSTYTQILYQIVFTTKNQLPVLKEERTNELYRYFWGILKNKNCHGYIINGVEDHIHIVTHIHPTIALASLVKDLKTSSTKWIKENGIFKDFPGWQAGYGAFTYSAKDKDRLIEYVKNQKEHHRIKSFTEEDIELLIEHGISFDEKYLL